jgi:transcriptional regulator with XRE-family HTH domain
MNDKKIGIQIKKARAEAQLTQSNLCNKIGVTWEMISRYENGKSSPRKNLEQIAKILGKPIQYFFGVEELPISDEIRRLTDLLMKKGMDLQKGIEIQLIENIGEFSLNKSLSYTKQTYSCPSWIYARYKKAFALKLDEIESDIVSITRGDIGYFSSEFNPRLGNYVIIKDGKKYRIDKYSKNIKGNISAVLVAIEKRYIKD